MFGVMFILYKYKYKNMINVILYQKKYKKVSYFYIVDKIGLYNVLIFCFVFVVVL